MLLIENIYLTKPIIQINIGEYTTLNIIFIDINMLRGNTVRFSEKSLEINKIYKL